MVIGAAPTLSAIRTAVGSIPDPEIPVITIAELGILRSVDLVDGTVVVTITPTYSGCPAMEMIRSEVEACLDGLGVTDAEVRLVYSPAWTTEWLSAEAKARLDAFGIAPPGRPVVECPRCRSVDVRMVSHFGSTACKALMVCATCREPFDLFKDF
jgi:ring-1,2-phenylacetyl-CoA epoxidase subunit PaaD